MPIWLQDIQARKSIGEAIVTGDINLALDLIHQAAPNMLTKHHALNFRLQCQKFMELVRRCPCGRPALHGCISVG